MKHGRREHARCSVEELGLSAHRMLADVVAQVLPERRRIAGQLAQRPSDSCLHLRLRDVVPASCHHRVIEFESSGDQVVIEWPSSALME